MKTQELEQLVVPVTGMTCQACAHTVERALSAVPGVHRAEVNFGSRSATIEREPGTAGGAELASAVAGLGYRIPEDAGPDRSLAEDVEYAEDAARAEEREASRNFLIAAVSGGAALVALWSGAPLGLALVLSIPVPFIAGASLLRRGLRAALRLAPDMNTLVALGSLVAWFAAATSSLAPDFLPGGAAHLRASLFILVFVLLGRTLESRARRRTGDAVRHLLDLAPPEATVMRRGVPTRVPLEEVRPGNLVQVEPGERIPVDGEVLSGASTIDESMLTGESTPVDRRSGDLVRAGTMNGLGALSIKALAVGRDTALGRIAEHVRSAQGSRAPIQSLADRTSAVFVPAVLLIAVTSFLAHWLGSAGIEIATTRAVAVLVVACPCALGLATPTAIVAAAGRGARIGVLFRDGEAIERLSRIDSVAFDKTGTLTRGTPRFTGIERNSDAPDEAEILAFVAAVERSSEQPLARAVVREARERGLSIPASVDFRAVPGSGVRARVRVPGGADLEVFVASPRAAVEAGSDAGRIDALVTPLASRGETAAVVILDGQAVAALGFVDAPRPEALEALAMLRGMGVRMRVLSGDSQAAVRRVAGELGLTDMHAELSPSRKAELLVEQAGTGAHVAMVGDGINDAPALAAAELGIAMGGGTGVALEAADCALLADDLRGVPRLLELGRRTMRVIRTNLSWAFAYNLAALPVAAGALSPWVDWSLSPEVGAAAMAGSSLLVVLNSLRLRVA